MPGAALALLPAARPAGAGCVPPVRQPLPRSDTSPLENVVARGAFRIAMGAFALPEAPPAFRCLPAEARCSAGRPGLGRLAALHVASSSSPPPRQGWLRRGLLGRSFFPEWKSDVEAFGCVSLSGGRRRLMGDVLRQGMAVCGEMAVFCAWHLLELGPCQTEVTFGNSFWQLRNYARPVAPLRVFFFKTETFLLVSKAGASGIGGLGCSSTPHGVFKW